MAIKKLPADFEYLKEMFQDTYYPRFLVEKVKEIIQETVVFIENGNHTPEEIQTSLDQTVIKINDLQNEFDENGSEIETVARESIADTIGQILHYFDIDIDIEEAIRERDW